MLWKLILQLTFERILTRLRLCSTCILHNCTYCLCLASPWLLKILNIIFRRGFERDGAKTSEFFKLQKIRTEEKLIFKIFLSTFFIFSSNLTICFAFFYSLTFIVFLFPFNQSDFHLDFSTLIIH